MSTHPLRIFSGSAHPELADEVAVFLACMSENPPPPFAGQ
jgi:hypothetical protein